MQSRPYTPVALLPTGNRLGIPWPPWVAPPIVLQSPLLLVKGARGIYWPRVELVGWRTKARGAVLDKVQITD